MKEDESAAANLPQEATPCGDPNATAAWSRDGEIRSRWQAAEEMPCMETTKQAKRRRSLVTQRDSYLQQV